MGEHKHTLWCEVTKWLIRLNAVQIAFVIVVYNRFHHWFDIHRLSLFCVQIFAFIIVMPQLSQCVELSLLTSQQRFVSLIPNIWHEHLALRIVIMLMITTASLIARFLGPTWGRQDPGWPHVSPINLDMWVLIRWLFSITRLDITGTLYRNPLVAGGFPTQWMST